MVPTLQNFFGRFPRIFRNFSESIGPISKMFVPFYSSFQGLSIPQVSCSQISTLNFVTYRTGLPRHILALWPRMSYKRFLFFSCASRRLRKAGFRMYSCLYRRWVVNSISRSDVHFHVFCNDQFVLKQHCYLGYYALLLKCGHETNAL